MRRLILALALVAPAAASAADADNGKRIAERWCASCHVATPEQKRAGDTAPPLATIAADPALDDATLLRRITQPHPPMPNLQIGRGEAQDLVAYLKTLR